MRKSAIIIALFALLTFPAYGQTLSDIEKKLDFPGGTVGPGELAPGKRLLIRNFYSDKQLTYGDRGTALGAHLGSWLGDGYVEVVSVDDKADMIRIVAKRLRGHFHKTKSLRFEDAKETVEFNLPKGQDLQALFVRPDENLLPMISPIWRRFLTGTSAYPSRNNIQRVGGGVSAPQPILNAEPSWPDHKDKAKYEGFVSVACVVDEEGHVRDVEVLKPIGAGLDEKGAEAVAGWQFQPATLKKQPVAVHITIEVDFHLY
jgi:TonB family protein